MAHGLNCSAACGIFRDQGSNPCPLHWKADSQPLCHQRSPGGPTLKDGWDWDGRGQGEEGRGQRQEGSGVSHVHVLTAESGTKGECSGVEWTSGIKP